MHKTVARSHAVTVPVIVTATVTVTVPVAVAVAANLQYVFRAFFSVLVQAFGRLAL